MGLEGLGLPGLSPAHKEFMIGLVIRTTELAIRTNRQDCGRMLICTGGGGGRHEGYLEACGITSGHLSSDFDIACHLTKSPGPKSVTCLQAESRVWDTTNTWARRGHLEFVECLLCELWHRPPWKRMSITVIPDICHEPHEHVRVNFFWPV